MTPADPIDLERIEFVESLTGFLYELRERGFAISPRQYTAAHNLLVVLAAQRGLDEEPHRLKTLLAPILCTSPKEQERFYEQFDRWLGQRQPVVETLKETEEEKERKKQEQEEEKKRKEEERKQTLRRWTWRIAATALGVAVVVASVLTFVYIRRASRPVHKLSGQVLVNEAESGRRIPDVPVPEAEVRFSDSAVKTDEEGRFFFVYGPHEATPTLDVHHPAYNPASVNINEVTGAPVNVRLSPTPIPTPTPTPTGTPVIIEEPEFTYGPYFEWILLAVLAGPVLVFLLWFLWRRFRRWQLERWRSRNQPDLEQISVRGVEGLLFRDATFRRFAQELRRHRRLQSSSLDALPTVDATSRRGGLFTPVYGSRQLTPEYLALIDRASFRDQKASLEDTLLNQLGREGVFIDRYYFDSDPRSCQKKAPGSPHVSLQDLAVRHPDHRLLIFTNGDGLISGLSGRPHRWVEMFSLWHVRVLFTPVLLSRFREASLESAGFVVLPADAAGMEAFIEAMRTGKGRAPSDGRRTAPFPPLLAEEPERWLGESAPEPELVKKLRQQLRFYLGTEGYYWLSACAVYPEMIWDLTLYFGYHLTRRQDSEKTLRAMVRLPWFRQGAMPDWFRQALIAALPPQHETKIRRALQDLLISYLKNPQDGFSLDVAPDQPKPPEEKPNFWRRTLEKLKKKLEERKWKRFLRDFIRTEQKEGPARDYVFLTFLSGNSLAIALPQALRDRIRRQKERFGGSGRLHNWLRGHLGLFLLRVSRVAVSFLRAAQKLLFQRGQPFLGMRSANVLAIAVLSSAVGLGVIYNSVEQTTTFRDNNQLPSGNYNNDLNRQPLTGDQTGGIAGQSSGLDPSGSSTKINSSELPIVVTRETVREVPNGCANNILTAADGYVINDVITVISGLGLRGLQSIGNDYPIGPMYLGKTYSPELLAQLKSDASALLKRNGLDPSSATACVRIVDSATCTSSGRGAKCVDVTFSGSEPASLSLEVTPDFVMLCPQNSPSERQFSLMVTGVGPLPSGLNYKATFTRVVENGGGAVLQGKETIPLAGGKGTWTPRESGNYIISGTFTDADGKEGNLELSQAGVTVSACTTATPTPALTECPAFDVSGPTTVRAGTPLRFTANDSSGRYSTGQSTVPRFGGSFNWTVSNGTITSGQGTNSIFVDTKGLEGQTIVATLEVKGVPSSCTYTFSSASVMVMENRPTINQFTVTFHTQNNAKDKTDSVFVEILQSAVPASDIRGAPFNKAFSFLHAAYSARSMTTQGSLAQLGPLGSGDRWANYTSRTFSITPSSTIPVDQCRNLRMRIRKEPRGEQWDAQVEVSGRLSTGQTITLLSRTSTFRLGGNSRAPISTNFDFTCPGLATGS